MVSGKKNALQEAVEKAEGEIILITDADCQPGSDLIRSMVSCFDKDTDMVAGFSRTAYDPDDKAPSVKWFEHFDFIAMFAVSGGLIMSGKYFSCSAQNLGYRRSSWEKVGGYKKIMHLESGDDVNLMQLFRQAGMRIEFNLAYSSYMTTKPTDSWIELINQRSRWASNTSYQVVLNPEFFVYLISVLINTFLPFILLFINLWAGVLLILIRLIIEMSFIHKAFIRLKVEKRLWLGYPLWMLIQPMYMLIVAVRGIFSVYKWK